MSNSGPVCFMKVVFWKLFSKFFCLCLSLEKLVNENHFLKVMNKLEMSCYLLIISNLIFKLLIAIYFVMNFFFQFHPLDLI